MNERRKTVSKRKRIEARTAVFLTALLVLSAPQTGQALGTGVIGGENLEDTRETEVVFPRQQGTEAVKTELAGSIEMSLISVTLPSGGFESQVSPAATFDVVGNPGGQIVCPGPESLRVTNNSVVAIRLETASVEAGDVVFEETFEGGPEYSFQLMDRVSKVNGFGRAILVLGRANRRYTSEAGFEQYVLYPGRTGTPITELKAGKSAGLQLYGTAEADFYGEYQFTVKPILKISAIRTKQCVWLK